MTTQCDRPRPLYMDETGVPIVIELDIPALERLRAAAGIQGPYLAIRNISGDSSRLCGCSERLDRMQAQLDEISRSHRILDDRTADSAVDLRQRIANLELKVERVITVGRENGLPMAAHDAEVQ